MEGSIVNFGYALGIKCAIHLAFSLLKRKTGLSKIVRNMASIDTLLFSLFCGGYVGIFRILLCNLRKLRSKDDGYNSALAGMLASLWLIIDRSKARRIQIASYMFARSFDSMSKSIDSNNLIGRLMNLLGFGKNENNGSDQSNSGQAASDSKGTSTLETSWVIFFS